MFPSQNKQRLQRPRTSIEHGAPHRNRDALNDFARAFESGAGPIAQTGPTAEEISVEQLCGVSEKSPPQLAADRPTAGRTWDCKGQSGRRTEFEKRLEWRRASEESQELEKLVSGWCLGSEEFRQELLTRMSERKGPEHFGPEIKESAQEKAQRLIRDELRRLGWGGIATQRKPQRRPGKGSDGVAFEAGNDDDAGLDSRAIAHGNQNASGVPALLASSRASRE
jgi:hypothetical protein